MNELQTLFERHYGSLQDGASQDVFQIRAPGRVNLLGGHVDYNGGFVLPIASTQSIQLLLRPREDRQVTLYSTHTDETRSFSLDAIEREENWLDYVKGVARELELLQVPLHGFEGVIVSDLPAASGLSSSAALEVGTALAFLHLAKKTLPPIEIALLCQRAENRFVGVNCGIMDQTAVAACEEDFALLLDCRSLEIEQIPFALKDHALIVTDSGAPRELASSAYNERRAQCEEGLETLQQFLPGIKALRDVSWQEYLRYKDELSPVIRKRVRHVVSEIERTWRGAQCLKAGDFAGFGECIDASHNSLRDDYEVSSFELDWLVDWARRHPGVLGSRLTGAGFGGCTITLIESSSADEFIEKLPQEYFSATGRTARSWRCKAAAGAALV